MSYLKTAATLAVAFLFIGCAAPTTVRPSSDQHFVVEEQRQQLELVYATRRQRQDRVWEAALPILYANADLCGERTTWIDGSLFDTAATYEGLFRDVVLAAGIHFLPTLVTVSERAPAYEAGLREGDVIVAVNGKRIPVPEDAKSAARAGEMVAELSTAQERHSMTVLRAGQELAFDVVSRRACNCMPRVLDSATPNAFADGKNIYITSGMLQLLDSKTELQTVIAHELAHNTEGHIDKKRRNSLLGRIAGAALDIFATSQGIYGTSLGSSFEQLAAMRFSQDFEREADYVGIYMLERAGIDTSEASNVWRKMAVENATSIFFAHSHPTTAERFVNLDTYSAEVRTKREQGEPLLPQRDAN